MTPDLRLPPVAALDYPRADAIIGPLAAAFAELQEAAFERRSHFIDGRFENLYLARNRLPGLEELLGFATTAGAHLLDTDAGRRRCGFWLNAIPPGSSTSRHTHEENDEPISGIYDVAAPEHSRDIGFQEGPFNIRVSPRAGRMLLFPPSLVHWVEPHRGCGLRLSIAFNLGPLGPCPRDATRSRRDYTPIDLERLRQLLSTDGVLRLYATGRLLVRSLGSLDHTRRITLYG